MKDALKMLGYIVGAGSTAAMLYILLMVHMYGSVMLYESNIVIRAAEIAVVVFGLSVMLKYKYESR